MSGTEIALVTAGRDTGISGHSALKQQSQSYCLSNEAQRRARAQGVLVSTLQLVEARSKYHWEASQANYHKVNGAEPLAFWMP
ncbi:hypothetical protein WJX72_000161 [[Myrmecia] bisecta]|uniref:Uncharacterized protein n=1 Tax=[Myrmecia] bisecta TaxID=41462 RepID=A0AAW1R4J7_9CHLO